MKENLEALNRNLIFKAMRTIFYILPIVLITEKLYKYLYGEYHFNLKPEFVVSFLLSNNFIVTILFFCGSLYLFYVVCVTPL